jgi:hypothetical protein
MKLPPFLMDILNSCMYAGRKHVCTAYPGGVAPTATCMCQVRYERPIPLGPPTSLRLTDYSWP